ncbi:MAG: NifB/NifX family molybdenum-iron cluster-binding protein [Actinomycetota bacterium]|nr:NifB/NifX family molybdenum-iron cluster-binding protein [Actinomycetota bacterium]
MRVAFATTDGVSVNEHFGRAGMFSIYEFSRGEYNFLEARKFADGRDTEIEAAKGMGAEHEDKVQKKVDALSDCRIVYMTEVGGPSAARLIKNGVMPLKVADSTPVLELMEKLVQTAGKQKAPVWLRRALEESAPENKIE